MLGLLEPYVHAFFALYRMQLTFLEPIDLVLLSAEPGASVSHMMILVYAQRRDNGRYVFLSREIYSSTYTIRNLDSFHVLGRRLD